MTDYDADPSLVDTPLHLSEIEELAQNEGRGLLKDTRKLIHFIQRVQATVKLRQEQVNELKKELTKTQIEQQRAGAPTTLSPLDAVRYLSDDQRVALFDSYSQSQLAALQRERAEAIAARKRALQFAARIRYEMVTIVEEPTLSSAVRQRVETLLGEIAAASQPSTQTVGASDSPFSAPPSTE